MYSKNDPPLSKTSTKAAEPLKNYRSKEETNNEKLKSKQSRKTISYGRPLRDGNAKLPKSTSGIYTYIYIVF